MADQPAEITSGKLGGHLGSTSAQFEGVIAPCVSA